jgi:beta-carotene ketolase (CrtW type)
VLAAGIVLGWLGSWLILLPTTLSKMPVAGVLAAIVVRTWLQTGLFIVAHDAMHGILWPSRPAINRLLGRIALVLYAALPYEHCRRNHHLHHRHAGTGRDPDSHGPGGQGLLHWYGQFMAAYLSPAQVAGLGAAWLTLAALAGLMTASALGNVLLYGILPTLLSSLQLFVVGTYLPHRSSRTSGIAGTRGRTGMAGSEERAELAGLEPMAGADRQGQEEEKQARTSQALDQKDHGCSGDPARDGSHQPRSLDLPTWLSLLSCYHFGYHREHHAFPHLAWHELPGARRGRNKGQPTSQNVAVDLWGR